LPNFFSLSSQYETIVVDIKDS